jgi:uncharacterized protein (TIGR03435 family)
MAAPAAAALAQPPNAAQPKFEVASVRLAVQRPAATAGVGERSGGNGVGGGGCPQSLKMDQGRVDMKCATLTVLIGYAFRLSPDRVKGPDWMGSTRFDIAATIPEGASKNQVPEMVQALLAERFKLAIHRGTTNQSIYALVVAKGGLKVKEAAPEAATDADALPGTTAFYGGVTTTTTAHATTISNPEMGTVLATDSGDRHQRWEASSSTFAGLADLLEMVTPFFSSPVIDMTRLKGRYRLVLEVSLNDASMGIGGERTAQDMEAAVLKAFNDGLAKLGLKLERRKGPVESIVVDHVEKMPTEN